MCGVCAGMHGNEQVHMCECATGPTAVQFDLIQKLSAFLFGCLTIFKISIRKRGPIRKIIRGKMIEIIRPSYVIYLPDNIKSLNL